MSEHKSVPEWAIARACDLLNQEEVKGTLLPARWAASADGSRRPVLAFARYIAEHEDEPVDPLLIEAREIARTVMAERELKRNNGVEYSVALQAALAALKAKGGAK